MSATELGRPRASQAAGDDILHCYEFPADRRPRRVVAGDKALCGVRCDEPMAFEVAGAAPPAGYPLCVVCVDLNGDDRSS